MAGNITAEKVETLGGGTAGWMAANVMIKAWKQRGFNISLIESPDIGIVGVDEIQEFVRRCSLKHAPHMTSLQRD